MLNSHCLQCYLNLNNSSLFREWCIERGIPWRKGYLLEGVPGSGKTSLIHAIASHLDLDIYIVSLATAGLTDGILNKCLTMV